MQCPKCNVELKEGIAIKSSYQTSGCIFGPVLINGNTLKLIDCLKCPKCGYSDDGVVIEPQLKGYSMSSGAHAIAPV
jgi:hypothetical protein